MKAHLLGQLNADAEYFARSTGALTEDDSAFAPVDGVFTVAQHVAHAAQTIRSVLRNSRSSLPYGADRASVMEDR